MKKKSPPIDQELRDAVQRNAEKISDCAIFVCLFSEDMLKDVIPIIQMGLAVYMDKPIALLVPEGMRIPKNLERMAAGAIEYFTPGNRASAEEATSRLMIMMAGKGLIG